jgi:hypothetical protein
MYPAAGLGRKPPARIRFAFADFSFFSPIVLATGASFMMQDQRLAMGMSLSERKKNLFAGHCCAFFILAGLSKTLRLANSDE